MPYKSESAEQIKFVGRVRHFYPDVVIFSIPNGGWRRGQEATKLKEEGTLAGASDLVVAEARGGWFGLFVEMKRADPSIEPSDVQAQFIDDVRARGYRAEVAHGCEAAWTLFQEYMSLTETARVGPAAVDAMAGEDYWQDELLD